MTTLKANVWVDGRLYSAGSRPPSAVAKRITNPRAWGGDPPSRGDQSEVAPESGADGRGAASSVGEPPRGGPGSGEKAWREFLTAQGVNVPEGASREDLHALWDQRKPG